MKNPKEITSFHSEGWSNVKDTEHLLALSKLAYEINGRDLTPKQ